MMPSLPASLRPLLERETLDYSGEYAKSADDAWWLPERVPDDVRPALPRLIAAYEAAMRPATTWEIGIILGRLAIHFPLPDRPSEHHQMAFDDYAEDLAEYPIGIIVEVARDWRHTEKWWPKICELRERCDALLRQCRKEGKRLQFLQWCCKQFDGRVPRLMERCNRDQLCQTIEGPDASMLEAAMRGQIECGKLVWVLPPETRSEEAR
jgi:hypothetical protein